MRMISICSNYGSTKDGIGHYTRNIVTHINSEYENVNIKVYSGETSNLSKRGLFTSYRMSLNILKLGKDIIENNVDIVLIEYPFHEWNPLIVVAFYFIKLLSIIYHKKIILSLHEYERTSIFRKFIIRKLIRISDAILVTNPLEIKKIVKNKSKIFTRRIPSNIELLGDYGSQLINNRFCFFGLISSSKAFKEMMESWKLFNKNNEYELHICTSSDLKYNSEYEKIGVILHQNYPDAEVSEILKTCDFMILPIKPYVDNKNGTLKAALLHGCIPIGKVSYGDKTLEDIFVKMNDYNISEFYEAYNKAICLKNKDLKREECRKYSEKYTIKSICKKMISDINSVDNL